MPDTPDTSKPEHTLNSIGFAITKETKITLGLTMAFIGGTIIVVGALYAFYAMTERKIEDNNLAAQAREFTNQTQLNQWQEKQTSQFLAMQAKITDLTQSVRDATRADSRRLDDIEKQQDTMLKMIWTPAMMEVWVLQSREAGIMVVPGPIYDRYKPE